MTSVPLGSTTAPKSSYRLRVCPASEQASPLVHTTPACTTGDTTDCFHVRPPLWEWASYTLQSPVSLSLPYQATSTSPASPAATVGYTATAEGPVLICRGDVHVAPRSADVDT